jgi:tRNA modification GTPase
VAKSDVAGDRRDNKAIDIVTVLARETIFALSSGAPPAGLAVIRISGETAGSALMALSGRQLPTPRRAVLTVLSSSQSGVLDQALTLWFPGPHSATGEDVVELHLHGGRAVVAAVLSALAAMTNLRPAEPGEFTRRAFENGCLDYAQVEGLGDLLEADTEAQRRNAIAQTGGGLTLMVTQWDAALAHIAARVEALIDFSDEDDVTANYGDDVRPAIETIVREISSRLNDPPAERLRDGLRIVIIGPPNAGKSTLLNRLVSRDAAIVSPTAGTTRDTIEVSVNLRGLPLNFIDTAGVRVSPGDNIEAVGIARAREAAATADIILALAPLDIDCGTASIIRVHAKCDIAPNNGGGIAVSALEDIGMTALVDEIVSIASRRLPSPDRVALNNRHRAVLAEAVIALTDALCVEDEILIAENLRRARASIGKITGHGDTETMLDALFGAFCIGK